MKYSLLLICLITVHVFAQESTDPKSYDIGQRKGNLFFSLGSEYRITPYYNLNPNPNENQFTFVPTNIDLQNSGVAFNYTFDYFVTKNLALGFSNSIRYDLITLPIDEITSDFGFRPANNSLIFGFHFYLDYHFKIFKDSELFVRIGRSLINRGTEYTEKETFYDDDGNKTLSFIGTEDTGYEPWNYAIGYKKNKISLTLGIYTSAISEYFNDDTTFIIPYLNFKYNIGKL
jgi:hypothetical protein